MSQHYLNIFFPPILQISHSSPLKLTVISLCFDSHRLNIFIIDWNEHFTKNTPFNKLCFFFLFIGYQCKILASMNFVIWIFYIKIHILKYILCLPTGQFCLVKTFTILSVPCLTVLAEALHPKYGCSNRILLKGTGKWRHFCNHTWKGLSFWGKPNARKVWTKFKQIILKGQRHFSFFALLLWYY